MRRLRKRLLEAYLENEEFQAGINDMAERSGMKANDFILSADREGLVVPVGTPDGTGGQC
jgi:hypothetical protein